MKTLFASRIVFLSLLLFGFGSCQKENVTDATKKMTMGIASTDVPTTNGCQPILREEGTGNGGNGECTGTYDNPATGTDGKIETGTIPGFGTMEVSGTITGVKGGVLTWTISADGKYLSWSGPTVCGLQVVVKGGSGSYIYTFADDCKSGSGLVSPLNDGGQIPQISNFTFCWNECPPVVVCTDETAMGGNSVGARPLGKNGQPTGAWWYYFETGTQTCQRIYAGQTIDVGQACLIAGEFFVNFNDVNGNPTGWKLDDVSEPVKIQGYDVLPTTGRPAAGLFTTYKGKDLTNIDVRKPDGTLFKYYVIHLDVTKCVTQ